jgi:glycosyltransferase involved in cell wall biosynthesis
MTSTLRISQLNHIPTRIFVDASHTCASGKNSGIERVVRNILSEYSQWCEGEGLPAPALVTHHGQNFYPIDQQLQKWFDHVGSLESNIRSRLPIFYLRVANRLSKWTSSAKFRKWFLPEAGHLGAFKLIHNGYDATLRRSLPLTSRAVEANESDLFLLPDAYWARRGVWQAAAKARQSGATIATMIYDLIPLTHPQYVGQKRTLGFQKYLHQAIEHSDLIIAISQTVQEDVKEYIRLHRAQFKRVPSEVRNFTLGAELNLVSGSVRPEVRSLFSATAQSDGVKNPYLMVATFDPRKNHHFLLDAFDLLWQKRDDLRLCLIGRVGSLCEDVIQRIRNHPALNKQLFAFYDIKDSELQHCYKTCRGVVFPSIVEGFGLPIVESLWFGKRTFASNTPIHREVGQGDCVYFDLDSPSTLANEVEKWELIADDAGTKIPTRRPLSWNDSSRQLMAHCLNFFRQQKEFVPTIGEAVVQAEPNVSRLAS